MKTSKKIVLINIWTILIALVGILSSIYIIKH